MRQTLTVVEVGPTPWGAAQAAECQPTAVLPVALSLHGTHLFLKTTVHLSLTADPASAGFFGRVHASIVPAGARREVEARMMQIGSLRQPTSASRCKTKCRRALCNPRRGGPSVGRLSSDVTGPHPLVMRDEALFGDGVGLVLIGHGEVLVLVGATCRREYRWGSETTDPARPRSPAGGRSLALSDYLGLELRAHRL